MKKIVLASAAMGGAALLAFGAAGTFAAFSDSASESAQSGAGTLTVSTTRVGSVPANNVSVVPGGSTSTAYYVLNDAASDTSGYFSGSFNVISENENGCLDPELAAGDGCDKAGDTGEFGALAQVSAFVAQTTQGGCSTAINNNREEFGVLSSKKVINGGAEIKPGEGLCVVVVVSLPADAGNNVQSDTTDYTFDVTLNQLKQTV